MSPFGRFRSHPRTLFATPRRRGMFPPPSAQHPARSSIRVVARALKLQDIHGIPIMRAGRHPYCLLIAGVSAVAYEFANLNRPCMRHVDRRILRSLITPTSPSSIEWPSYVYPDAFVQTEPEPRHGGWPHPRCGPRAFLISNSPRISGFELNSRRLAPPNF
ncbi:hypothetical protein FKP32DRAFT_811725 [Trametes sanguinea]|nr:hypothetical protein FKP32DRAFT_811725 [Trametes sanguinea]